MRVLCCTVSILFKTSRKARSSEINLRKNPRFSTKEILAGKPSEQVHPDEGEKSEQAMLTRRAVWGRVDAVR